VMLCAYGHHYLIIRLYWGVYAELSSLLWHPIIYDQIDGEPI
jgi:hypothetical protein